MFQKRRFALLCLLIMIIGITLSSKTKKISKQEIIKEPPDNVEITTVDFSTILSKENI